MNYTIETERLYLRPWIEADKAGFRAMNSDPQVMEYFPRPLSEQESDALIERISKNITERGYGLWALETKSDREFIGFTGLNLTTFHSEFTPCIEVGWRLKHSQWGKGYASEGATACLNYGFNKLDLDEIFSFTSVLNKRSIKVMERIGMERVKEFDHPNLTEGEKLRRHVLFKSTKTDYLRLTAQKVSSFYD